jgi:hypothetical protein
MQASLPIEKLIFPHIETGDWALYDPLGGEEHVHSLPQVTPKQTKSSPPSCWHADSFYCVPVQFQFRHGVLVLLEEAEWVEARGSHYSFSFNGI